MSVFILLTAFTCENEPLEGDFVTDEPNVTCEQALMNTATAAQNFAALTEENYEEEYSGACSALKTAFENQLEACGDPDGSLQAAIDALGTCNLNASPCEVATSAAATAQQVLNQATEEEYADACNAYAFVLQQKINECGDEDGSIQDIIDGLGDCSATSNPSDFELRVTAGSAPIVFNTANVVVQNGLVKVSGTVESSGYSIYFEVPEGSTGTDIMQSFVLSLISDFYPSSEGFEDFTSTITTNDNGLIVGTFWGTVVNNDNGYLSLTQGVVNISY
uniref:hypothetical protein n=1 Tax=Gelidibacter sp. TaxID=2018083 RepID=UPI00404A0AAE